MCGEKASSSSVSRYNAGSPPRVRGKGVADGRLRPLVRITPACAGKRRSSTSGLRHHRDHPRVCGEKFLKNLDRFGLRGSPPRVRGKGMYLNPKQVTNGITPACAGKRAVGAAVGSAVGDHPRVCGEKCRTQTQMRYFAGSPPRVRGKENSANVIGKLVGITPACAGKSACQHVNVLLPWDHPRVCGEKRRHPGQLGR